MQRLGDHRVSDVEEPKDALARLRYTAADKSWTLYWRDRNLRFHIYDLLAPSRGVEDLLSEIDRDLACMFGG